MTKVLASPLSRKATLVALNVSQWTGRKLDKEITAETNERHNASEDAGRYNKLLLEKHRFERINAAVTALRDLHYKYTKPWAEKGIGILPNVVHVEFSNKLRKLEREYNEAADEFRDKFAEAIEERKRKLNGMFNPSNYPDPDEIRGKFKLVVKTYPVPDADDFRSDVLDDATVADIKRELVESNETVLTDAMKHTAKQITEVVGHMAEKLREYGEREKSGKRVFFFDSLVENVRDLASLLPAFNLTDDPKLRKIAARISKELTHDDAKVLRENDAAREAVAKSAEDILKDVSVLLG